MTGMQNPKPVLFLLYYKKCLASSITNVNYDLKTYKSFVRYPSSQSMCTAETTGVEVARPPAATLLVPKVLAKAFVSNVVYNLSLRDEEAKAYSKNL